MSKLVIATRGSKLALRQVELVVEALSMAMPAIEVETRVVRTQGDRDQSTPLETIGGQGVFVKDIELALISGEADFAVHSLKDMPAQEAEGLVIAAVLAREDARDVLVARDGLSLDDLAPASSIGTDSKRRAVQLLAMRPELQVVSIRGNVDTRVSKVEAGDYDAVVLAAAGLQRLGLATRASQIFTPQQMIPAVGQGVIAVQCRRDAGHTIQVLEAIDHAPTRAAITAERAYLQRLGAGCRLPVGAYAEVNGEMLHLRAFLADDSGKLHKGESTANLRTAATAGKALAERLLMSVQQAGQTAYQ